MIIEEIKNIKTGRKELRNFGLTIGIVLCLLGWLLWWQKKDFYNYFFIFPVMFISLGLFLPVLLKPIYKVWMTFAVIMGWIMTRFILSILFYLVFTSISLVAKLLGNQLLDLKMNNSKKSYWNYKEPKEFKKSDYERQF